MFDAVDIKHVLHGHGDKGLGEPTPIDNPPEELVVAAGEIMAAMGQDYGMGSEASESRKAEFWDKARRLAARLHDFFEICESMPHREEEGGEEEEAGEKEYGEEPEAND